MNPRNLPGGQPRRRCRPGVEALEGRELLSPGPIGQPHISERARPSPATIQAFVNTVWGPVTFSNFNNGMPSPLPQPTPHEVQREVLFGKNVGFYTVGPGRFTDNAATIHYFGKSGGANGSLKNRFQIIVLTPTPNATPTPSNPTGGSIFGLAHFLPANALQSQSALVLDLIGDPKSVVNGLPTHFTWTSDIASGIIYTNVAAPLSTFTSAPTGYSSSGFYQGAGTLDIKYLPDKHPLPNTLGSGRVVVSYQGLDPVTGILSPIFKGFM